MRVGICFGAHRGKQLLQRRHPQLQTERAIAIVRIEPVVTRLQHDACCDQHCLMTGAADLEEDLVLSFELDLFVVESTREIDRKSTRLNSSHGYISYAVFCLKKKTNSKYTNQIKHASSQDV